MLTPILATRNPYVAAEEFVRSGWALAFATPEDSEDRLAVVELEGAQVMLGVDTEQFLRPDARPFKGAGVEFYVEVPEDELERIHAAHARPQPIEERAWGVRAFRVELAGYRFLIAGRASG